eukprot:Mycagemm_TRINITY_DN7862_c0_g1::TRINITY_DN7862_c0_g1_i1::g.2423::m.2423 type:complete len:105 gc:universal TRINITY_DN7862_c0_g1_i1:694-380(-)
MSRHWWCPLLRLVKALVLCELCDLLLQDRACGSAAPRSEPHLCERLDHDSFGLVSFYGRHAETGRHSATQRRVIREAVGPGVHVQRYRMEQRCSLKVDESLLVV